MPASVGLFGKLPARGDFLRAGLPRAFTDPWDDWLQAGLSASRAALGEAWLAAWMEAPIWRFALPDGACGPDAVLGLWMPSVDKAGRHFPLTLACILPGAGATGLARAGEAWLDGAEQAGLDALEQDLGPEALLARLPPGDIAAPPDGGDQAIWWSSGSPYVAATRRTTRGLPDARSFATLLHDPVEAS
ncbi:MAG: type VI secretion system-associated protein TagF [Rhodospirillales bacterium]|nr:type VI secretion system-associated protein TagF [Rhodospirillales bacterium]MDE2197708.1 type VI secretion system-associated protein TagF [Rhodospirillales bacterium]MDE2576083.1 type VI secretion system-associated protein TagF [Rhodospirillales bacterium]